MWDVFFGTIDLTTPIANARKGFFDAINFVTTATSLQSSSPPSAVKTDEKATPIISNSDTTKIISDLENQALKQESINVKNQKKLLTKNSEQQQINVSKQKTTLNPNSDPHQPARRNNDTNSRNRSSRPHLSNEFQAALMISAAAGKNFYNRKDQVEKRKRDKRSSPLTGDGARNAVLIRGIRPTEFQSGDAKKAKERDLENIGIRLAGLEFELSRTEIRKGNLNTVKYHPEFGSYNSRGTKECKNDESEKRLKIKVLKEDLLKNYSLSDIKKVYASKNTELQRLKNTPSVRPSAPLVVTRATSSYLTRY
jgi:hypothetical protein